MAGGENIIECGSMTNGDAKILGRANDEHVRPANVVQSSAELRATTGGNKDSLGSIQLKPSSFGKNRKASLQSRQIWNEVLSTNSNVVSVETDVYLGGASNHVVKYIHK